jgi:hypothetical protein
VNLKDAALRAAVLKRLKEKIRLADEAGRAEALDMFLAARDTLGVKSVDVVLPDGQKVASATLPAPQPGVVVDEEQFRAWVQAEHPDEIVQAVRESFRRAVMKSLVIHGDKVVNRRTGETVSWARVRPAADRPTHFTITFTPAGRELIEQAWADGKLNLLDVVTPALGAGDES